MSVPPFQDGFPNQPQAAINASYFLTPDEKGEWNNWLQNSTLQEKDELVNILHQMWIQAKQAPAQQQQSMQMQNPAPMQTQNQQMGQQSNYQSQQQAPQMQQPQGSVPMQQPIQQSQPQMQMQNPVPMQSQQPQPYQQQVSQYTLPAQPVPTIGVTENQQNLIQAPSGQTQYSNLNTSNNYAQNVNPNNVAEQKVDQPSDNSVESNVSLDVATTENTVANSDTLSKKSVYTPSPIIADPESTDTIEFKAEMKQPPEDKSKSEDEFSFATEEEVAKEPVNPVSNSDNSTEDAKNSENQKDQPKKGNVGIDFNVIRENANKDALAEIKIEYVKARENQEKVYSEYVSKTTDILSNFEDINDYIEAMTDKVLDINDKVISQSQDIQELKNATSARGPALQDQVDEIKYDIQKLSENQRNTRIEIKRSNDELRQRLSILEADSFRQGNDGIEARIAVMKSEMAKMQDTISNFTSGVENSQESQSTNKSSRINRLDNIDFPKTDSK